MFSYNFVLGKATDLCRKELETVFNIKNLIFNTIYTSDQIYHLDVDHEIEPSIIYELGGVTKIARFFGQADKSDDITSLISNYLRIFFFKIYFFTKINFNWVVFVEDCS